MTVRQKALSYMKDANLRFIFFKPCLWLVRCSSVLVFLPLMKSHKGWGETLGVQKCPKAGVQGIHW